MSLIMPLITLGAALFVKSKFQIKKGKVNWLPMTEAEMGSVPMAILAGKIETGEKLPAPTNGLMWKPIRMLIATSVFSSPIEVEINVLADGLQIGERPDAMGQFPGYLTARQISHPVPAPEIQSVAPFQWVGTNNFGSSYLTPQELMQMPKLSGSGNFASMGSSYLTTQELASQPKLSSIAGLAGPHHHRHHRGGRGWGGGGGYWGPDVVMYQPPYVIEETPGLTAEEIALLKAKAEEERKKKLGLTGFGDVSQADALKDAINAMIPVAKANGLVVAKLDLHEIKKGDIVVLSGG